MIDDAARSLAERWMEELLGAPLPEEPRATCDHCAMLPAAGERPSTHHFNPSTKCCTYFPALPNFLVGRILEDDRAAEGRRRVTALIERRSGVSPIGLLPHREPASRPASFGRAANLRCPYYLDGPAGSCSIWTQRNGVCLSFFCKHSRGAAGLRFRRATERLLHYTERQLAIWCALELDLGNEALSLLLPHPDRPASELADDARAWGRYAGRELELFRRCAALVEALPWRRVAELGGAETLVLQQVARAAFAALSSNTLPATLVLDQLTVEELRSDVVTVVGYSSYDPLELPRRVFDLLSCFDGAPLEVVRGRLAREGLDLSDALLRRLVDHEILVEPGSPPAR